MRWLSAATAEMWAERFWCGMVAVTFMVAIFCILPLEVAMAISRRSYKFFDRGPIHFPIEYKLGMV